MISKQNIRELINQKLKDSDALISKRRYGTAFYISGYALELALKLKICKIFKFTQGFPENKIEFQYYQNTVKQNQLLSKTIKNIQDIRNHDLNKLLFYSGAEYKVRLNLIIEWAAVVDWNPEMRYKIIKIKKQATVYKLNALKSIIKKIL